jgi:hypothetical protein
MRKAANLVIYGKNVYCIVLGKHVGKLTSWRME